MAPSRLFRTLVFAFLLALSAGISGAWNHPAEAAPPQQQTGGRPKPGAMLVRLAPGASAADLASVLRGNNAAVDRQLRGGLVRLSFSPDDDGAKLLADLRRNRSVAQAGYDLVVTKFDAPNDPAYARQWHFHTSTGGINLEGAWDLSPVRGAGVVVAVIDTGVAYENADGGQGLFGPKRFAQAPDLAGVPIVAPWDWIGGDAHANDEHGHGTHVASTILQQTNDGASGAGVSAASLMPLRILDFAGDGQGSDLIDSIYYAADHGAQVINMSLGFSGTGAPNANGEVCTEIIGLADALEYANAMGVTVVAASGNDGAANVACPAAYPTVIAVGATDYDGAVTFYSNRGGELDVTAPGGDPNADRNRDGETDQVVQQTFCLDSFTLLFTGDYTAFCDMGYSGTSMASPHVAGTAALLKAQLGTLSPAQIRDLLQSTARDRGTPGWDAEYGHGVIDAAAALASVIANPPPPPPPGPAPQPRPAPPQGATNVVGATLSTTSIRLDWTDNATGESGFRIDRSADGGVSWVQAGSVAANVVTYTNYGLSAGTQYAFRVRSFDTYGSSAWSNIVFVATFPPPAAPSGASALALSASSVRVSWVDNSTNEQGFKVERSTDGMNFNSTTYAVKDATSLNIYSLNPSTHYWFRVRAYEGAVNSGSSNVAEVTTFDLPAAPQNLVATATNSTTIRLDWQDMSATEQGFKIERSTDGGATWAQAGQVGANTVTWTNWNLSAGTTYWYRVRGYDGIFNGDASNIASATTLSAPSAPWSLTATALNTTQVRLNWVDASTTEQGFKIERSSDGGATWAQIGTAGANATTYTVSSLAPSTAYSFKVRAFEGLTNGPYSPVASATTFDPPSAPINVTGTALGSTSIRLNWTNTSSYQTAVKVERSTDGVNWVQVAWLTATATTWTNMSLLPDTAYQYRLRAAEGNTHGPYSAPISVSTFPPASAPANLSVSLVNATSVKLTWTDTCAYETGFKVERSTDGVTWTQVAQIGANATSFTNVSLTARTTYYYRVRAYDSTTNGAYSQVVSITMP